MREILIDSETEEFELEEWAKEHVKNSTAFWKALLKEHGFPYEVGRVIDGRMLTEADVSRWEGELRSALIGETHSALLSPPNGGRTEKLERS